MRLWSYLVLNQKKHLKHAQNGIGERTMLVSFTDKRIRIFQCSHNMEKLSVIAEIPLSKVKDCYNLRIDGSLIMLTRQSADNHFQIIWPEEVDFDIGERESFICSRKSEKLFFKEWHEDATTYTEEIVIREYPTGNLIEKMSGAIKTMPDGQKWILR